MKTGSIRILALISLAALLLFSCREKTAPVQTEAFSHVVGDSLKTWCQQKLSPNRISFEGSTIRLLFFEEELNLLWKPSYNEEAVNTLAAKADFQWQELPVHEGNRRWEMTLPLQAEDSSYSTPNNLLLYLFR